MNNELTTIILSDQPSADCVTDWQDAARFERERIAAMRAAPEFDWSEFRL